MLERDVLNAALRCAKSKGVPWIRMVLDPRVSAGWPDVIFLIPGGRPLFIEFKKPKGKPTARQLQKIALLNRLRYDVAVCDNSSEAKQLIEDAVKNAKQTS